MGYQRGKCRSSFMFQIGKHKDVYLLRETDTKEFLLGSCPKESYTSGHLIPLYQQTQVWGLGQRLFSLLTTLSVFFLVISVSYFLSLPSVCIPQVIRQVVLSITVKELILNFEPLLKGTNNHGVRLKNKTVKSKRQKRYFQSNTNDDSTKESDESLTSSDP